MIPSSYHTALNLSLSHSLNEIIDILSAPCVPMAIPVCRHIFSQLRTKLACTGIWTIGPTDNWSQTIGTTAMDDWYHVFGPMDYWYLAHTDASFSEFPFQSAWKFLSYTVRLSGYAYMYAGPVKLARTLILTLLNMVAL